MRSRLLAGCLAAALAFLLAPPAAQADVDVGLRVGLYTDVDEPFAGIELLTRVTRNVFFNPNFEWVFAEGFDYFTLNADFHYDFPTHGRTYVWLGAGLALVRMEFEGSDAGDTDPALNILGGVGLRAGSLVPYIQAKVIAKDNSEFVIAFGVRF